MAAPPVLMVTLTTCGHCADAKAYFARRGIKPTVVEFDTANVALRRKIAADMRAHGVDGFPFVMIGGTPVNGYDPETFDRLLSMN
jgi:glutaredoxin